MIDQPDDAARTAAGPDPDERDERDEGAPRDDERANEAADDAAEDSSGEGGGGEDVDAFTASLDDADIEVVGFSAADLAGVAIPDVEADDADEEEIEFDGLEDDLEDDLESEATASAELAAEVDEARERLLAVESRADDLRERLVRTAADFENFRKRVDRDRVVERKQASAGLVREMLPALDNFDRALEQAAGADEPGEAYSAFVEGVRLIHEQLFGILRRAGLEPVDASGAFDPNVHEALMQEETEDAPHLSIRQVFEPGYRFGGRLLRPARVKVAHNPGGADAEAHDDVSGDEQRQVEAGDEPAAGEVSDDERRDGVDDASSDDANEETGSD